MEPKEIFPFTLYHLGGRMVMERSTARMIASDQELFAAFMSMAFKFIASGAKLGVNFDPKVYRTITNLSDLETKTFTIDELALQSKATDAIRNLLGHHVTAEYMGRYLAFMDLFTKLRDKALLAEVIESVATTIVRHAAVQRMAGQCTTIEANIDAVSQIYDFTKQEQILLEHATMMSMDADAFCFFKLLERACDRPALYRSKFELAYVNLIKDDLPDGPQTMKALVELVDRITDSKTSRPLAFNIVRLTSAGEVRQLSQFWSKVISYDHADGSEGFEKLFIKPVHKRKSYSNVIARLNEKMIPLFKSTVDAVLDKIEASRTNASIEPETGVNFLIYGAMSLDKDQAVQRALAGGIELELYEAVSGDYGDEASIAWAAMRLLEGKNELDGPVHGLLIREASRVISRGSRMSFSMFDLDDGHGILGKRKDADELDSDELLLTKSRTPAFWYTTDAASLSAEAVGKFMLHLEVIPGTRADRKAEIERIAEKLNLPPEVRLALSKYLQLGAVQVETAARVVELLELNSPESHATILQLVEESQRALGREKTEELRTSVTKYDLTLLNIHGKFPPGKVIEALKKKGRATMCFYGLPGTGKTQLAEYIADQLDKPLLVKMASDILSKYVGENEQNLAAAFQEAKAEGAVFLLDEADSFLRDRKLAKSGWEVTMVNELLQQMERHQGIFICASNLFDQLDAAALRRFTFKFKFMELSEDQRMRMFANESGVNPEPGSQLWTDLQLIKHLTPGDFATVKRQANMFETELTPEDWITQLAEEAKAKANGVARLGSHPELY